MDSSDVSELLIDNVGGNRMPCFSLRGKMSFADNSIRLPERIFDYVSPDRTRAWRVVRAVMWPITVRADTSSNADARYLTQCSLGTDWKKDVNWGTITDPTENRNFAWAMWGGFCRDNGTDDYIVGGGGQNFAEFWIDPDTLVTKELWIAWANTKEGTTNPIREWGYMIELEEVKVSPSQSVFQQIKGMGQDVDA